MTSTVVSGSRVSGSRIGVALALSRLSWWVVAVMIVGSLIVAGWPSGDESKTPEQRTEHLAQQIRCPTCAGLSVAQSEAPLARSSREEIRAQVLQGKDDEQIKAYFVSRYGDTALMSPARTGFNRLPWLVPAGLVLVTFVLISIVVRRWRMQLHLAEGSPTAEDRMLVEAALRDRS